MAWVVESTGEYDAWWSALTEEAQDAISAVVEVLEEDGPNAKRPIVGEIKGSRHANMKELIPASSNIRILFAFDPRRTAILLLGGDKTGLWDKWYRQNVPRADALLDAHLATLEEKGR